MQLPAATIQDTVAAVFRDPAYNRTSLLGRFFSWLWSLIQAVFSRFDGRAAPTWVFWVLVSLSTAGVLLLLMRWAYAWHASRDLRTQRRAALGQAGLEIDADAWQSALALAARGDYTAAAHALYAGLIRVFARRGEVVLHDSKTIGDYGRDLSARSSPQLGSYREFARSYERVIYGVGTCDRPTYERLLGLARPIAEPGVRTAAGTS